MRAGHSRSATTSSTQTRSRPSASPARNPNAYEIVNNTIYEPAADGIRVSSSHSIHLRNNIIWTQAGYGVYIADDSQNDFTSNYNLLYATGNGFVGYWQGNRATLTAWQFANLRDGDSLSADPLFDAPTGVDGILGSPNTQGLSATYYANTAWAGNPVLARTERQVDFSGYGTPDPLLPYDNWSGRWQGTIRFDAPGDYTFYVNSGGPQRLVVNGEVLVNAAADPGVERAVVYHAAAAGTASILYQMADDGGYAQARVDWSTPLMSRRVILPGQIATGAPTGDGGDDNFHEQSLYGSYKPGAGFSPDAGQSPAIDRGQPADSYANEPTPNGGYVNLGAYGNTSQASESPQQYVLVTNPNGGERLPQKTTYNIRWRSFGFAGDVEIQYSTTGLAGPYNSIVADTPNTGSYNWTINPASYNVSDQYIIRISSISTPAIAGASAAVFSVLPPINNYYVNDGSSAGDEYTSASGSDANDGLTPATPKASISAILLQYAVQYGDTIYVDTGVYNLTTNISINHNSSGVRIQGPTSTGHATLLNRGNANAGAYVFQLNNADAVTLSNLWITGGYDGINLSNSSWQFTLGNSSVYDNANAGLNITDVGSVSPTITDNTFYGNAADANHDQNYDVYIRGQSPTLLRNQAYHNNGSQQFGIYLDNVGSGVTVNDNTFWNNSDTGLLIVAGSFEAAGNISRDSNRGFYFDGNNAALNASVHDNVAYGITTNAFEFHEWGQFYNNQAYDSGTGFAGVYLSGNASIHENLSHHNTTGISLNSGAAVNNRVYANTTGIYLTGGNGATAVGNTIYDNATGIYADTYLASNSIVNNLIYDNSARGVQLTNVQTSGGTFTFTNNTVMELASDALEISGSSQNVVLKNNILWSGGAGHYAVNVDNSAQRGVSSDYNDLYFTSGARLGLWQNAFATLADWRYELGLDTHSISADPLLVNPAGNDGIRGAADYSGLRFDYFPNATLSGAPTSSLYDRVVGFAVTYGNFRVPGPGDNQSFRWTGEVYLAQPGTYTFWINSLNAQRLILGGSTLIDDWTSPSHTQESGSYVAAAAGWVSIEYDVADLGSQVQAQLLWATPDNPVQRYLRAYEAPAAGPAGIAASRPDLRYSNAVPSVGLDDDFHLSSSVGGFHGGLWFADPAQSPAIDHGNPTDPVTETAPAAGPLANQTGGRVNLGFEGNTPEASRSPAAFAQLLAPDGFEKYRIGQPVIITWRSAGLSSLVNIDLSIDGGQTYVPITTTLDDGSYAWTADTQTLAAKIRISDAANPAITAVSDNPFTIGAATNTYYINDSLQTGDQYTTAPGSNANTGTTPADPMGSLTALLGSYSFSPGDTIYVDTGAYQISANIPMTNAHSGMSIIGPTAGPGAVINRGNASSGAYVFQLNNADAVTLSNLWITGGYDGINLSNSSWQFTLGNSSVYDNANAGLNITDVGSVSPTITDNTFYGNAADANHDQNYDVYIRGQSPTLLRNQAYHNNGSQQFGIYLDNVGSGVTVNDNTFWNNSDTGLLIVAGSFEAAGNISRDSNRGFYFDGNNAALNASVHDNVAYGITTNAFEFHEWGQFYNNQAYDSGTGFAGVYLSGNASIHENLSHHNTTGISLNSGAAVNNRVYANTTGIYLTGGNGATAVGNTIYDNATGIYADTYLASNSIVNNLIYDNSARGVQLTNVQTSGGTFTFTNNTVMELASDALEISGSSQNVVLKNNILWSGGAGHYAVNVDNSAQRGVSSDYNDLYFTSGARLGLWQNAFATLADWRYELGLDTHSISADPLLVNPAGNDGIRGAADYSGLRFDYFPNATLSGAPTSSLYDRVVGFAVTYGNFRVPGPGDNQSFRWTGEVYLAQPGTYTFWINSLNAQRLILGGSTLIDDWTSPSHTQESGSYVAAAAGWVSIEYDVADLGSQVQAQLLWATPDNPVQRYLRAYEAPAAGPAGIAASRPDLRYSNAVPSVGLDDDFHLSSSVGSFHGGLWFADPAQSPAIDHGNPTDPVTETAPAAGPLANQTGGRVNLGFEGNTPEASRSHPEIIQLLSFIGGEKVRQGQAALIQWRSVGFAPGELINIDFSSNGGTTFTPIATNRINNGGFAWNSSTTTLQGVIRIRSATNPAVSDASRASFTVGASGHNYYVNDGSQTNDQYTTAVGNNANSGTTPADPMASLNALLSVYHLGVGDTVYVDAGYYGLSANVRIGPQAAGATIVGPAGSPVLGADYAGNVLADAPLAYYRLDDASGTTATDYSGHALNATYVSGVTLGGPSAIQGDSDASVTLNGTSGHVRLPTGFGSLTNGITLEVWVYPTASGAWQRFFDMGNGPNSDNIVFARYSTNNDVYLQDYNGSTAGGYVYASGVLELNKWQQFVATIAPNGAAAIYKNGRLVASGNINPLANVVRTSNYIGRSDWSTDPYYAGSVDEAAIYDKILTPDRIANHYYTATAQGATLNRGNTAAGRFAIELNGANKVSIRNLQLTGAETGLSASSASGLTLTGNTAYNNDNGGFYVNTDVQNVLVQRNIAYGSTSAADTDEDNGFYLRGQNMTIDSNTAYKVGVQFGNGIYIDSANGVTLTNNLAYNNTNGLTASLAQGAFSGNEAKNNNRGLFVSDSEGTARSPVYSNNLHDNNFGLVIEGNTEAYGNTVSLNRTQGVQLTTSATDNTWLHDNYVVQNALGIDAKAGRIYRNRVVGSAGDGILLDYFAAVVNANAVYGKQHRHRGRRLLRWREHTDQQPRLPERQPGHLCPRPGHRREHLGHQQHHLSRFRQRPEAGEQQRRRDRLQQPNPDQRRVRHRDDREHHGIRQQLQRHLPRPAGSQRRQMAGRHGRQPLRLADCFGQGCRQPLGRPAVHRHQWSRQPAGLDAARPQQPICRLRPGRQLPCPRRFAGD